MYSKEDGGFVDRVEKEKQEKEAEAERLEEEVTKPTIDFSAVANGGATIINGNNVGDIKKDEDILF